MIKHLTHIIGLLCLILLPIKTAWANDNVVNVYNWSNFMPAEVLQQFEKETGIHVNYMEFDNDETLYAKLKANPKIGFDVIVPSSNYVARMRQEGMLQPIDHHKIATMSNLNPSLLNKPFDPNNRYSLPFIWGTTGIAVNDQYYDPKSIHHWKDLWQARYQNQLLALDDMREIFSIALITLGYSVNDVNPTHIKAAYEQLRQLMPNIKLFNTDTAINLYVDEDVTIGFAFSGDIFLVQQENPHVQFIFPDDHFVVWMECVAIPTHAPHIDNAYRFLTFINRPEIAAKIAENIGYSTPNAAAVPLLPQDMQKSPILNPTPAQLKRAEYEEDLGPENYLYEQYWNLLKLG